MDIRTKRTTGISLNYKDSSRFIRSHTTHRVANSHLRVSHWITDFSFSPNGHFIQSSGADNCIFVHDFRQNGALLSIFEHDLSVVPIEDVAEGEFPWDGVAVEWSSDSRYLVSGADDCCVRIWDLYRNDRENIQCLSFDKSEGRTQTLSRSLDHDAVAVGTSKGYISIFST